MSRFSEVASNAAVMILNFLIICQSFVKLTNFDRSMNPVMATAQCTRS